MSLHDHLLGRSSVGGRAFETYDRVLVHDPYLEPASKHLQSIAGELHGMLEALRSEPAQRRPRADATERRKIVVANLIANAVTLDTTLGSDGVVIADMGNTPRSRYERREVSKGVMREALYGLHELGFLERLPGEAHRVRTAYRATNQLRALLLLHAENAPLIGRASGAETILLKTPTGKAKQKRLVEYTDNRGTDAMRHQMVTINEGLTRADIRLRGRPIGGQHLARHFVTMRPKGRQTFDAGGRLFGGFWQYLKRDQRPFISLNGEPLTDLDYRAMFVSLAYVHKGLSLPEDDPYVGVRGLSRADAKKCLLNLLCRTGAMQRRPEDLSPEACAMTGREIEKAMCERHPEVADLFGTSIGLGLMKVESDILIQALLSLAGQGITALPMHDGLMVQRSQGEAAKGALEKAVLAVIDRPIPVRAKPLI